MILIHELSHVYSPGTVFEKKALDHVDLKIEDGEILGIIGHTGSGKSTLIQHLNGLLKPTEGAVYFNGEDIHDKDFSARSVWYFSIRSISCLKAPSSKMFSLARKIWGWIHWKWRCAPLKH